MTAEVKVGDTEWLILTGNKTYFTALWVLDLVSVWSDRTQGSRHAGRWRRKSELLVKQRQQLIRTLLHSQS